MVRVNELLRVLPPYRKEELMIVKSQDVGDIMSEVVEAHKYFSQHYDHIADFFFTGDTYETCALLWDFCKANIAYRVESDKKQTTKSPAAVLSEAHGDCKHYAGFIAGVLDAINRCYHAGIKWRYCFANYDRLSDTPQHVFVKVSDPGGEIWVDPVLNAFDEHLQPVSCEHKKVTMLARVSGIGDLYNVDYVPNTIGWTWQTSTGWTQGNDMPTMKVGDPFYGPDFLGFSRYGDIPKPSPENDAKFRALRDEMQAYINKYSPEPYELSTNMMAKALSENIQNWNFLYHKGTSHKPRNWKPYLQDYVLWKITDDGRLTFDRDVEPPHNYPQIHKLVDWLNFLVQHYSDKTYIPTIEHVKRLGSGWKTPEGGSAWHVIHTGDKNLAKFTNFAKGLLSKIPGLSEYIAQWGLSADTLTNFAGTFGWGQPGTVPIPPGEVLPDGSVEKKSMLPWVIGAGAVLLLATRKRKKVSGITGNNALLIGGGAFLLLLALKKKTPEPVFDEDGNPLPPSTATPPYVKGSDVLPDTAVLEDSGMVVTDRTPYGNETVTVAPVVPGGSGGGTTYKPGKNMNAPDLIDAVQDSFNNSYNQYT